MTSRWRRPRSGIDPEFIGMDGTGPGGFHRFRDKISQLNKVKYLWDMSADEIISLLPKEFNKFKNE